MCMVLESGRKLEYLKNPTHAQGEHADIIKQYLNLQSNLELRSYLS